MRVRNPNSTVSDCGFCSVTGEHFERPDRPLSGQKQPVVARDPRVAFCLSACVFLFAFVAFFVARDLEAARLIFMAGTITAFITAVAGNADRKKSLNLLQEMDEAERG